MTFLWSTSWVLIKLGLQASLPALSFAGLRYSLAFACLLPLLLALRSLSPAAWRQLALLGVVYYSLTQGAQFVSLAFLPAATLTLIFNFTPLLVALAGGLLQHEAPGRLQWAGMLLCLGGAGLYFLPASFFVAEAPGVPPGVSPGQALGYLAAFVGLLANAASAMLGRRANTQAGLSPLLVTTTSMGIGGLLLLLLGALTQGSLTQGSLTQGGEISLAQALIIAWLALVNTAFAFTLWNRTLRTLTAVESSILNGMMLPQIALLAWVFLDEPLSARQIAGLLLVGGGTLLVQLAPLWGGVRRAAPPTG